MTSAWWEGTYFTGLCTWTSCFRCARLSGMQTTGCLSGVSIFVARVLIRVEGFAWLALAWAERLSGRDGPALEALSRSWIWAPQSRTLSLRRVVLASIYWPELDAPARARLLAEMRFANQSHPVLFQRLLGVDPRTATLWRIARSRGLDRSAFPTPLTVANDEAGPPPAF